VRSASVAVIVAVAGWSVAHAETNPRRRKGTRLAQAGLASTLVGVGVGAFAIGLGNDRPAAARPFFVASGIALGAGTIGLATGGRDAGPRLVPVAAPDHIGAAVIGAW
jgi:hypothetical protein